MTVINFENYKINHMEYLENINFDSSIDLSDVDLENSFDFEFKLFEESNQAIIIASVKIGESKQNNAPFYVFVQIEALFSYNEEDDKDSIGFKKYLNANALAIIFPYLRQTISNLTNMSNRFPAYVLPTINIMALVEEDENFNE